MHKILIPVTRESGSIATNVITGSYPATKKTLEAKAGKKLLTFGIRFYELDCLDMDVITDVENDPNKLSDLLKIYIEQKGFTHTKIVHPITRQLLRGTSYTVDDQFLNDTAVPLPIKLQLFASQYLESIFGYWNVYEMDFEKLQIEDLIGGEGDTGLEVFAGFKLKKVKIKDISGANVPAHILDPVDIGSPVGSPIGSPVGSPIGSPGLATSKLRLVTESGELILEVDTKDALNGEFEVDFESDENQKIYIECDDWYDQSYEIKTKHSIKY